MINYIIRRVLIMIPTLLAVSVLVFVVIQLPPGDIITSRLQELQAEGQDISEEQIAALRAPLPPRRPRCLSNTASGWVASYKAIWAIR